MRIKPSHLIIAATLSMACPHANAQSTPSSSTQTQTFTPDYFTRFAPQTALDMVNELPGFVIEDESDDDGPDRGFGQASGNVLINGQRISGKSNTAENVLARIAAESVDRIEVLDGASLDIPGLSGQVANVIAEASAFAGTFRYRAQFQKGIEPNLGDGEISVSGKRGALDWNLSVELDNFRDLSEGVENLFDGSGDIFEIRDEFRTDFGDVTNLSGTLAYAPSNGHIANLNFRFGLFNFTLRELGLRQPFDGLTTSRTFLIEEDELNAEIGGDYEFDLGPGRLKAITLFNLEHSPIVNSAISIPIDGTPAFGNIFDEESDELETIGRLEYSLAPSVGQDWQIAVESAFNVLDTVAEFSLLTPTGELEIVPVPGATTRVEELRGEVNLTHGRRLTSKISAQASIGAEVSRLSQSGATGLERTFFRPKGFVSFSWNVSNALDITARAEREVGQLNFSDFVSNVNLGAENENAGNPDLVPEQSWIGEIEFEQNFGDYGAATLGVFGERIEDVIDRIPITDTLDGVGNIGNGNRFGTTLNATLKLDPFGLNGVQFEIEGEARRSSVTDPITGRSRRINRDLVSFVLAELRWDVPSTDYAFILGYEQERQARNFRIDEASLFNEIPGFAFVQAEHKDIFGMRAFLRVGNLVNTTQGFRRAIFVDNRLGPVDFIEDRERNFNITYRLGISGTF
ncbi:MAG: TonB-dependent receptor [Pseudomonadota bacterium]